MKKELDNLVKQTFCIKDVKTNGYVDVFSFVFSESVTIKGTNLNVEKEKIVKKDNVSCFRTFPDYAILREFFKLKEKMKKLGYNRELEIVEAPEEVNLSSMESITFSV